MQLTREAIENYRPTYVDRIPDWTTGSSRWPGHFRTTRAEIDNGDWLGDAHEAATTTSLRHESVAVEAAGMVDAHVEDASADAATMLWAQSLTITAIANTERDGFPVGDDLKPTDPNPSPIPQVQQARNQLRVFHEQEISYAANRMMTLSQTIGSAAAARGQALAETTRYDGQVGGVQAVDNKVCDDPNYQDGMNRRLLGAGLIGAAIGGMTGPWGIPEGFALGVIGDALHEISGDGPKCK